MALPLLPLAISAGAQAIGAGLGALPTRADRRNKERLSDLELLEEQNLLGLTDRERDSIMGRQDLAIAQQQAQQDAQTRAQRANNMGGEVEAAQIASTEQGALARTGAISDLERMDIQRRQEQRQEIEDRTAALSQRQQENRAALGSLLNDLAGAGLTISSQNITTLDPRMRSIAAQLGINLGDE